MANVLLVEDVPVVQMTLRLFLERGGYSVTVCGGGEEAKSRMAKERFDAVVTDLWMSNGDGLALIDHLRANDDATPVLAITGGDPRSPQSDSSASALRAGANEVLLKPVTKSALLDAVREIMKSGADEAKGSS